jgi:RHS repeat-associated protein
MNPVISELEIGHFGYTVDPRGNRTQALEVLPHAPTTNDTTILYDNKGIVYLHTIEYTYDALSRVIKARYNPGLNTAAAEADMLRRYRYSFDKAGNRTEQKVKIGAGAEVTTSYTYNNANQLTNAGGTAYGYDNNGNLTVTGGTTTHTWDRANRLLSFGGVSYKYDGLGNRSQQIVGGNTTQYLLDLQAGLPLVIGSTLNSVITHYVHGLQGIQAAKAGGAWSWSVQDGLYSVRMQVNNSLAIQGMRNLAPYGDVFGEQLTSGFAWMPFVFTGEMRDTNGLQYHRARYYSPALGAWVSLDPFEGLANAPQTLNRYGYVEGNIANSTDTSGLSTINRILRVLTKKDKWRSFNSGYCEQGPGDECNGLGDTNECSRCCRTALQYADPSQSNILDCYSDCVQDPVESYADQLAACLTSGSCDNLQSFHFVNGAVVRGNNYRPPDVLNALSSLINYVAYLRPNYTTPEVLDRVSSILINRTGTLSWVQAERGHDLVRNPIGSLGFHDHYSLRPNGSRAEDQLFHFWVYFNSTAQGGYAGTGDLLHECYGFGNQEPVISPGPNGRGTSDARLSTMAIRLGTNAQSMSPIEIGNLIQNILSSPWGNQQDIQSECLLPHYYSDVVCWDLATRHHEEIGDTGATCFRAFR